MDLNTPHQWAEKLPELCRIRSYDPPSSKRASILSILNSHGWKLISFRTSTAEQGPSEWRKIKHCSDWKQIMQSSNWASENLCMYLGGRDKLRGSVGKKKRNEIKEEASLSHATSTPSYPSRSRVEKQWHKGQPDGRQRRYSPKSTSSFRPGRVGHSQMENGEGVGAELAVWAGLVVLESPLLFPDQSRKKIKQVV